MHCSGSPIPYVSLRPLVPHRADPIAHEGIGISIPYYDHRHPIYI